MGIEKADTDRKLINIRNKQRNKIQDVPLEISEICRPEVVQVAVELFIALYKLHNSVHICQILRYECTIYTKFKSDSNTIVGSMYIIF